MKPPRPFSELQGRLPAPIGPSYARRVFPSLSAPSSSMRASTAAAAFLLVGCASAPARESFLLLETPDYGCGAVEGLGCGLALAPVLARIDALPGVDRARTSWTGRYVRIALRSGTDPDEVAPAVAAVLGENAHRVKGGMLRASTAEMVDVDRWLDSAETVELSRAEARHLAGDFVRDIAGDLSFDEATSRRLAPILESELASAFERAHAAGGGVHRLWEQFPEARRRFEERLAGVLSEDDRARVTGWLARALDG